MQSSVGNRIAKVRRQGTRRSAAIYPYSLWATITEYHRLGGLWTADNYHGARGWKSEIRVPVGLGASTFLFCGADWCFSLGFPLGKKALGALP